MITIETLKGRLTPALSFCESFEVEVQDILKKSIVCAIGLKKTYKDVRCYNKARTFYEDLGDITIFITYAVATVDKPVDNSNPDLHYDIDVYNYDTRALRHFIPYNQVMTSKAHPHFQIEGNCCFGATHIPALRNTLALYLKDYLLTGEESILERINETSLLLDMNLGTFLSYDSNAGYTHIEQYKNPAPNQSRLVGFQFDGEVIGVFKCTPSKPRTPSITFLNRRYSSVVTDIPVAYAIFKEPAERLFLTKLFAL